MSTYLRILVIKVNYLNRIDFMVEPEVFYWVSSKYSFLRNFYRCNLCLLIFGAINWTICLISSFNEMFDLFLNQWTSSSRSHRGSSSPRKRSYSSSSSSPERNRKRSRSRSSSTGDPKKRRTRSRSPERFGFL